MGSTVVVPELGSLRLGDGVLPIRIMVGQGLTVSAVSAGGDCSDIFFLSTIISLFFLPLSGTDGWVACGLNPFQQNFSDIMTLAG